MTAEFLITSLVIILLPGTGVIYTLTYGLGQGWKASLWAALGCTLGIIPAIIASVAGLAALLHSSALAFEALRYLGVLYLLYMAQAIWRDHSILNTQINPIKSNIVKIMRNGFLINILNPKLTLFFFAFLPQFIPQNTPNSITRMIMLGTVFMGLTFVVFAGYGIFAALARRQVLTRPKVVLWLRRSLAGIFVLLGVRLALSSR
tara:strand:- start:92 stop:703 length:612 start_codon:yes stop_codon:yes gene_type:complete